MVTSPLLPFLIPVDYSQTINSHMINIRKHKQGLYVNQENKLLHYQRQLTFIPVINNIMW